MRTIVVMPKCCLVFAVILCSLAGCRSEPPFWKDVTKAQALGFLAAQGISAKRLVINNAGGFELDLRGTNITNLNVLEGMPLEILFLSGSSVRDLSPLREMRYLKKLDVANMSVSDISPLHGLQLEELCLTKTQVRDLSPLRGMPLRVLSLVCTEVRDLTPLQALPLQEIYFSADTPFTDQSVQILRQKESLRCINYYGCVAEFWVDYDAGKFQTDDQERASQDN